MEKGLGEYLQNKDQRYCHCAWDFIIQGDLCLTNTYLVLNCISSMWLMADIGTVITIEIFC